MSWKFVSKLNVRHYYAQKNALNFQISQVEKHKKSPRAICILFAIDVRRNLGLRKKKPLLL